MNTQYDQNIAKDHFEFEGVDDFISKILGNEGGDTCDASFQCLDQKIEQMGDTSVLCIIDQTFAFSEEDGRLFSYRASSASPSYLITALISGITAPYSIVEEASCYLSLRYVLASLGLIDGD